MRVHKIDSKPRQNPTSRASAPPLDHVPTRPSTPSTASRAS